MPLYSPMGRGPAARALLLLSLLAALALGGGCTLSKHEVLEQADDSSRSALLITGLFGDKPANSALVQALTPIQLENSLRRLVVRVSTWITFILLDPEPLLNGEQLQWAQKILYAQLPKLQHDQHIELNFKDRFKGLEVQVQVYAEENTLVFRFHKLVSDTTDSGKLALNTMPLHRAELHPQAGQRLRYDTMAVYLYEPLTAEDLDAASAEQAKYALLDSALKRSVVAREEEPALRALIHAHPEVLLSSWTLYWEKRNTLNTALGQGLFTPAEYEVRKQGLLKELGL